MSVVKYAYAKLAYGRTYKTHLAGRTVVFEAGKEYTLTRKEYNELVKRTTQDEKQAKIFEMRLVDPPKPKKAKKKKKKKSETE